MTARTLRQIAGMAPARPASLHHIACCAQPPKTGYLTRFYRFSNLVTQVLKRGHAARIAGRPILLAINTP